MAWNKRIGYISNRQEILKNVTNIYKNTHSLIRIQDQMQYQNFRHYDRTMPISYNYQIYEINYEINNIRKQADSM